MPDKQGQTAADAETTPDTPLHAYGQGREDDLEGDAEKLKSSDPQQSQRAEIEDEGDDDAPKTEAPPKA